jgi:hypothetical protein
MDFWQIVEAMDRINRQYGIPLPAMKPALEQFNLVDEARIRQAAAAWGTGGVSAGIPGDLAKNLPDGIDAAIRKAAERWEGGAYDSFQAFMDSLKGTIREVPVPAQEIGKVLENLADEFELNWLEIVGLIGAVAGLVVGVIGMVIPGPGTAAAAIAGAIGLVLAIVGLMTSIVAGLVPRVAAFAAAADTLVNDIERLIPAEPGTGTPERGDWKRITTNPIN